MQKTFHLVAPASETLTAAETVFGALGFSVAARTADSLGLQPTAASRGPSSLFRNVRSLHLRIEGDTIHLDATLPNPKALENRLLITCVFMEIFCLIVMYIVLESRLFFIVALASAASLIPIFFLIPWMLRQQQKSLGTALDLALIEVKNQIRPVSAE